MCEKGVDKFDKETYSNGIFTYGDTKEYTSGQFIVGDEIKDLVKSSV